MGETVRRPATPSPAERARTIAARGARAALLPSAESSTRIAPLMHHINADGTATVLLADEHPLIGYLWQSPYQHVGGVLEVADPTPVRLREPVRGLLWITGLLRILEEPEARAEALTIAEVRADSRLLDVGHGASILRMESASMVIADSEGTCSVVGEDFTNAQPDPFWQMEDAWLRHLDLSHRDVVGLLSRHLPEQLRGGHVRPLGLDRFGLRLRVESTDGDHDVRLAFSGPVTDTEDLGLELRRLLGCPFLAQQRAG